MKVNTKKTEEKKKTEITEINVFRAHQFKDGTVAFDMEVNGVTIYGCTLREGKNGQFVSFPSRKGQDGKYYSYAYVSLSEDHVDSIIEQIEKL